MSVNPCHVWNCKKKKIKIRRKWLVQSKQSGRNRGLIDTWQLTLACGYWARAAQVTLWYGRGPPPLQPRPHPPHPQHPHVPAAPHPQHPQHPPAEREQGAHHHQVIELYFYIIVFASISQNLYIMYILFKGALSPSSEVWAWRGFNTDEEIQNLICNLINKITIYYKLYK